jgi:hypothetical protein
MQLMAGDGTPCRRHGAHAADALLVAARELAKALAAASRRLQCRAAPRIGYACAAGALAAVAALAYDAIPDLPLAPQSDEPKKADFILAGREDFLQPLLLVQTVRLANLVARYADQLAVVELGRTVAAMFGGLTVLATIVLARRVVAWPLALAAGLVAAVTPLVAFHAQLLKEDIFLAPWLLLGLAALDGLRENAEMRRALAFGLVAGLATSAKYIGVVLLPLACIVPLIAPVTDVRRYFVSLAWSGGTAVAVFALINVPALLKPEIFLYGLNTEIVHALSNHIIVWHGWYSHFVFHWTMSLWPGLGPPLAIAGLAGQLLVIVGWRSSAPAIRLVLVFAALWYFCTSFSPMKPFMAIERHMYGDGRPVRGASPSTLSRVFAAKRRHMAPRARHTAPSASWPRRPPSPRSASPVPRRSTPA